MADFKKLLVWQKAHTMAMDAHRLAARIRSAQYASLRNQIIRAALSVPANIVEGCGVQTGPEFNRFVRIALNSTNELEYHLIAVRDLKLANASAVLTLMSQVIEVRKMLYGLRRHLSARSKPGKEVGCRFTLAPEFYASEFSYLRFSRL